MHKKRHPSQGKQERYIQPSILLGLYGGATYGYELIHNIHQFGFMQGPAPPGMIYRHLRQLERDGFVSSEWDTKGPGPAKRMYQLTPDGEEMLVNWVNYMENQSRNLQNFIAIFRRTREKRNDT